MSSSTGDFLFGGSPPSAWTSPIQSTSTMPDWWQAAQQGLITQASQIAAQPYPLYPGPEVASWDPEQTAAYNNVNSYMPQVSSEFNSSQNDLSSVNAAMNPNTFNSYMNPYTSDVVNSIAQLGNQNLFNNILPQVNNTFTGAGQFGSSQNANITNQAILNEEQNIAQQQSAALNQGFQNSMSNALQGQQQQISAGGALGALGQTQQGTGANQNALEFNMGQAGQQQSQNNLTNAYQNFENQAAYPLQQLGIMQSAINNAAPTANYFGYSSQPLNPTLSAGQTTPGTNYGGANSPLTQLGVGATGIL